MFSKATASRYGYHDKLRVIDPRSPYYDSTGEVWVIAHEMDAERSRTDQVTYTLSFGENPNDGATFTEQQLTKEPDQPLISLTQRRHEELSGFARFSFSGCGRGLIVCADDKNNYFYVERDTLANNTDPAMVALCGVVDGYDPATQMILFIVRGETARGDLLPLTLVSPSSDMVSPLLSPSEIAAAMHAAAKQRKSEE